MPTEDRTRISDAERLDERKRSRRQPLKRLPTSSCLKATHAPLCNRLIQLRIPGRSRGINGRCQEPRQLRARYLCADRRVSDGQPEESVESAGLERRINVLKRTAEPFRADVDAEYELRSAPGFAPRRTAAGTV